ncbi:hypothetical protein [Massilia sp. BSC265]|uniref:hypothetical protein n=1 Tax=Massilia sp. BSC265 TaxID=1549812 RepID=UPI0004E9720D|nr:hypothetical protein [Massilia sp. BSC265]KFI08381.1 hypothetical protein JN27_04255 [Massilia sp. BSC265]
MFHSATPWILLTVSLAAGPWQAAWAASPFAREVPSTYAKFEDGAGSLTLVVAEVVATDCLKDYDCPASRTNAGGSATVFLVTTDSVRPRYAMPVGRLQQGLKDEPLMAADFSCSQPRGVAAASGPLAPIH